jgi:hypothetical protein
MAITPPDAQWYDYRLDAMSFHFVKSTLEPDEPKRQAVVQDRLFHGFIHAVGMRPLGAGQPVQQSIRSECLEIAADFVELLARISHDFAGPANVAEFRCQL